MILDKAKTYNYLIGIEEFIFAIKNLKNVEKERKFNDQKSK